MAAALNKALKSGCSGPRFETSPGVRLGEVSDPAAWQQGIDLAAAPAGGTVLAISYRNSGVGVSKRVGRQRGGARNRRDRVSEALTGAQVANLIAAAGYAAAIGLPLNRMITIHWESAGVPLDGMAAATGRFTDLLSKTLARHKSRTAWLWVHEGGEGKGGHCHMLAHIPPGLVPRVQRLRRRWLRRIAAGQPFRARVVKTDAIGRKRGLDASNPEAWAKNLVTVVRYVVKGVSADAPLAGFLGHLQPGGRVIGKRCGTSQNIGRKARQERI